MTQYRSSSVNDVTETSTEKTPQTCTSLRNLSRSITRQLGLLNSVYGSLPLSPVQTHAIVEIGARELSIKQLATALNIDKSNASRAVSQLAEKGYITSRNNPKDSRSSLCQLTPQGKRQLIEINDQQNQIFTQILAQLSQTEAEQLTHSLAQYSRAINCANIQQSFTIRSITEQDNPYIARVIRNVSAEYGLTPDKGYGVADPTLDTLYQVYDSTNAHYWVIEAKSRIYGGAGIAPLADHPTICELQKMYFDSQIRGKGFAKRLALQAFEFARSQGYSHCYLETTACLKAAVKLYEKLGFEHLTQPLGNTGHDACELPMMLKL